MTEIGGALDVDVRPTPAATVEAALACLRRCDALDVAEALGLKVETSDRPCAACGRLSPGDWCILPDCPGALVSPTP